jgi:putative transposase
MNAVNKTKQIGSVSISKICACFNLKRNAYYKFKERYTQREADEAKVIDLVKEERKTQPRVGTKKLHKGLEETFTKEGVKVGRDRLFDILRDNNLLVPKKRAFAKTTNSYHHFHKYNNLIKDKKITKPNQVWVSDITYIRTVKGFCYLALITDLFSRKIVGFDISDSLELSGCLRALQKALWQARPADGLVHHSDRGVQYCSHAYVGKLKKHKISISMTEENHCYENAVAERVNGILKDEFYLDECFFSTAYAIKAAKSAIDIYNNKRLHLSLDYKTPNMVFKNETKFNL